MTDTILGMTIGFQAGTLVMTFIFFRATALSRLSRAERRRREATDRKYQATDGWRDAVYSVLPFRDERWYLYYSSLPRRTP
ncbi:hypothetical protein B6E66_07305 [Streptomyces maremycinicus]|nr:hypothetical protein B6E66_07305 [Streptomyces sp. B9173]